MGGDTVIEEDVEKAAFVINGSTKLGRAADLNAKHTFLSSEKI